MKPLARAGYASRGVIYAVMGFFSALAAIGAAQPMDSRQALDQVIGGPAGSLLTYALVIALVGYALWRLIQAGFDTDDHGTGLKGIGIRAGLFGSALVYLTLAAYAASLHIGSRSDDGGGFASTLTDYVGSRWGALMIAAVLVVVGVAHIAKAVREKYARHLEAGAQAMRVIHPVAKTGLIARGLVFLTLAGLFALRAWRAEGGTAAPGTREALEYVQSLPFGWLLLTATGLGLVCFALYSFTEAAFRRINVEDIRI